MANGGASNSGDYMQVSKNTIGQLTLIIMVLVGTWSYGYPRSEHMRKEMDQCSKCGMEYSSFDCSFCELKEQVEELQEKVETLEDEIEKKDRRIEKIEANTKKLESRLKKLEEKMRQ